MSAVADGDGFAAGLKSDGTVSVITTDDAMKTAVEKWKNVKFIAARNTTLIAITGDGKMYGVGDNSSNQYENTADASASASASASNCQRIRGDRNETGDAGQCQVHGECRESDCDLGCRQQCELLSGDHQHQPTETQIKSAKNSASISLPTS
jgi:hypothetical protein